MKFLDELAAEASLPRSTTARVIFLEEPDTCESPGDLKNILDLGEAELSPVAQRTLEALEDKSLDPSVRAHWATFKWRALAFVNIQDVFSTFFYDSGDLAVSMRLWYFYFESLHLVREALLCDLNGFYAASGALLRPMLEFTILQNYHHRRANSARSFHELEEYFKSRRTPSWHTLLKHAMPNGELGALVRWRLSENLRGLSESSSHAYSPVHSPKSLGASRPVPTLVGVFHWASLSTILQSALWSYYVNFPALFVPVDLASRFGFSPPVGLLVGDQCAATIRRTLVAQDVVRFAKHAEEDSDTQSVLEFYRSQPTLTDSQIMATWSSEDGPAPTTVLEGFQKSLARMRALREALAWSAGDERLPSEQVARDLEGLNGWRRLQTRVARKHHRK